MSYLGSALGLGMVKGAQNAQAYNSDEAKAERAKARVLKERGDQELQRLKGTAPTEQDIALQADIQTQELKKLKQANQQLIAQGAQRDTMTALDRFGADHDPRHLNVLLRSLEQLELPGGLFKDIATTMKVTPDDKTALVQAGYDADAIFKSKEAQADMIKYVTKDGKTKFIDMDQIRAVTGYSRYASQRDVDFAAAKAKSLGQARGGGGSTSADERSVERQLTAEGLVPGTDAYNTRFVEVEAKRREDKARGTDRKSSTSERSIERRLKVRGIMPGDPDYDAEYVKLEDKMKQDANPYDNDAASREAAARVANLGVDREREPAIFDRMYNLELAEVKAEKRQTSKEKNLSMADAASKEIDDIVGGNFFDVKITPEWRKSDQGQDVEMAIQRLEAGADVALTTADRKQVDNISQLIAFGDPSSQLSDKETGFIDNTLHDVFKYINNNTSGNDKTTAFAMYRNLTRHALYGSALTPGEIKSFNQAFGTLKQQAGPILSSLKQNLTQVRSTIDALRQTGNSKVMHFRLGVSPDKLDDIISSLDERIKLIQDVHDGKLDESALGTKSKSGASRATITPARQAELDKLLGKSK